MQVINQQSCEVQPLFYVQSIAYSFSCALCSSLLHVHSAATDFFIPFDAQFSLSGVSSSVIYEPTQSVSSYFQPLSNLGFSCMCMGLCKCVHKGKLEVC